MKASEATMKSLNAATLEDQNAAYDVAMREIVRQAEKGLRIAYMHKDMFGLMGKRSKAISWLVCRLENEGYEVEVRHEAHANFDHMYVNW